MEEFSENTAFLLVLEFLQAFKNRNGVSVNKTNAYIGENYQDYLKMLKIPIKAFLTQCKKSGTIEKITGANMKMTYKIKDVEELQKQIRRINLNEQNITLMRKEPVMKKQRKMERIRIEKVKSEKKEYRGKHPSKREDKAVSCKNITELAKINQIVSTTTDKKELSDDASISNGNISNFISDQKSSRRAIENAFGLHPFLSRIAIETFTDLHKRNGTSMDDFNSYIHKYHEARMEILKPLKKRVDVCTSNEEKKMSYSQKATRRTVPEKCVQRLNSKKEKAEFMKHTPVKVEQWRNSGTGSRKIKRKINDDEEKYIAKTKGKKNSRRTTAENSEAKESVDVSMDKKEVIAVTPRMAETSRISVVHRNTLEKCVQINVETHSLVQKLVLRSVMSLKRYNDVSLDQISACIVKKYKVDMKILKSPMPKFLNVSAKNDVFEKVNGTDAENNFKIKKLEKGEKCKQGLKRKSDSEKYVLQMKKKCTY